MTKVKVNKFFYKRKTVIFSLETVSRGYGKGKRIEVVDYKLGNGKNVYLIENKGYGNIIQTSYIKERFSLIKYIIKRGKNYGKIKGMKIEKEYIDKIREIINSEILDLAKIGELEESYVTDGFCTTINFASLDKKISIEFKGYNLFAFDEGEGRGPGDNVMKVLGIVKKIKKILMSAGIGSEYFRY